MCTAETHLVGLSCQKDKPANWHLAVAEVYHTSMLGLAAERLHQFQHASADDPVVSELRKTIQLGWPVCKLEVTEVL